MLLNYGSNKHLIYIKIPLMQNHEHIIQNYFYITILAYSFVQNKAISNCMSLQVSENCDNSLT